jgi:hypothetical protein
MLSLKGRLFLTIRLNQAERSALNRVVVHSGLSISDTVRQLIRSAAAEVDAKKSVVWTIRLKKRKEEQ